MASDNDFGDIEFCKKIVKRSMEEKRIDLTGYILKKISSSFLFAPQQFREEIINCLEQSLAKWSLKEFFKICEDSILGNVLAINYLANKVKIITNDRLELMASVLDLEQIKDPMVFEYASTSGTVILDLNEALKSLAGTGIIEKAAQACEVFFKGDKLERSKETIQSMALLYENSQQTELKFKGKIISSMLCKRIDLFLALINKNYSEIQDESSIIANLFKIYELLITVGVPVYFEIHNFKFEIDKFYNDNFFFALLVDSNGTEVLVMPFDEVNSGIVQKVLDLENGFFVTPLGRIGKLQLSDFYSFRKVREVKVVTEEKINICKNLAENEIGEKIRSIANDLNITVTDRLS